MRDAHLSERQAERVRRNLRRHRFEAVPGRSRADMHRHSAVRREIEPRRLLRACSTALDKAGDGQAMIALVEFLAL